MFKDSIDDIGINRIRLEFKAAADVKKGKTFTSVLIESDWNLKAIDLTFNIASILY